MKTSIKLMIRKTSGNGKQLVSMGFLIVIASLFFTTLLSFVDSYQNNVESYFDSHVYADVTLRGDFNNQDVEQLASMSDVGLVEGRWVQEYLEPDFHVRLQSLTTQVNIPYLLEGRLPINKDEIAVLNQYYKASGISLSETITINGTIFKVVGVVDSPEYIYYVKDSRTIFTDPKGFLIAFVSSDYYDNYNQIIYTENHPIEEATIKKSVLFSEFTRRQSEVNYQMYDGDLDQFTSFAYIFPVIFWLISFIVIYIILKRTIIKEHKYIGIMQAIGQNKQTIRMIYIFQFIFLGLISSVIGCILSIPVSSIVVNAFKSMIELPNLKVNIYPIYWIFCIVFSILGCLLFGVLSMVGILNEYPHNSMRTTSIKIKKRVKSERTNIFRKYLSFNTRYSITSTFRNKGRFFVMIIGLSASTALLVFSLGFNDSLAKTVPTYFNSFANYDVIVQTPIYPTAHNILDSLDSIEIQDKALQMAVTVHDEKYPLLIVDKHIQTLNLKTTSLENGIIIPEHYANLWHVTVGDWMTIEGVDVLVSEIIPLGMGLNIFTSYEYAAKMVGDLPLAYNTVYIQTNNLENLKSQLNDQHMIYSTAIEDSNSFNTILESLQVIILLLVACGLILGLAVIVSMNIINLSTREFEYMFMNIMGYSKGKILLSIFKETVLQLVISIPIGLFLGLQLLELIKTEFSQLAFALYINVTGLSYIIVIIMVIMMSFSKLVSSNSFLNRMNIVEGLKNQED